jgi:membrane-associated protease RseP (regulator of RpoE activity)
MVRFSLFGIPIEIQPWFWVTLAILGGGLGASSAAAFLYVCIFVIAGAVSILVHELGHALTIRAFGAPTRIVLQAFGGYATYPSGMFGRGKSFVVSLAGPAVQLVLAGAAWGVWNFVRFPTAYSERLFFYLFVVSLFWALLNLIPVIPLDGGQMMSATLGPRRHKLALQISMATAVLGAVVVHFLLGGYLFPIFMLMFAWQNHKELRAFRAGGW